MTNKTKFTIEEGKKIKLSSKYEAQDFIRRYLNKDNILSITLKSHLHIEKLLKILISNSVSNISEKQIDNMKFSSKVNYLNQLGYNEMFPKGDVIGCLKALNNIRDSFAHEIDYDLRENNKNLQLLIKNINLPIGASIEKKYKAGIMGLIGYIAAIRDILTIAPFFSSTIRFRKLFLKDRGFSVNNIFERYKKLGFDDFLSAMKS